MISSMLENSFINTQNSFKKYSVDFFLLSIQIEKWLKTIYKKELKEDFKFPIEYVKIAKILGLKIEMDDVNYFYNPIRTRCFVDSYNKTSKIDYKISEYAFNYAVANSIVFFLNNQDSSLKESYLSLSIDDSLNNCVLPALLFPPQLTWNAIFTNELQNIYKISYSTYDFESFVKYLSIKMNIPTIDIYNHFPFIQKVYSLFLPTDKLSTDYENKKNNDQRQLFINSLNVKEKQKIKQYLNTLNK